MRLQLHFFHYLRKRRNASDHVKRGILTNEWPYHDDADADANAFLWMEWTAGRCTSVHLIRFCFVTLSVMIAEIWG